ncbi:MAG: hypothetical protein KC729_01515, partial [Candidatus Eisenbacteria bacterium]|nr:hypothetical protein [Candidatus Eisenbacteria bacterium]
MSSPETQPSRIRPSAPRERAREESAASGADRFRDAAAYDHHRANPYLERRNELLLSWLPAEARTVVDIGCGPGIAGHPVQDAGRTVWSLDASVAALEAGPP